MSKLIKEANDAYYNKDEKIITDAEFDLLSDTGLETVNFRTKTEHAQPMGSLKKLKDQESFVKWACGTPVKATPKLDGNSIELVYEDGKLIKAITRGDGFVGNDVTDKIQFCNIVDEAPTEDGIVSRKCEAIMPKEYQERYEKNIRNVVSGLLNKKTPVPEELALIDVLCFDELKCFESSASYDILADMFQVGKEEYKYEIDGLVVELVFPKHEETDELLPANKVALKFNKEGVDAEVGEVEWNLGKHGRLTPVLILKDAVEIDGTMVKRVSASNYGILKEAGLGVGAKVQVIKSGDIIPFISKVVESNNSIPHPNCPECGYSAKISDNGIHATCYNDDCGTKEIIRLQNIFKIFDLEFVNNSTVEKLYDYGFDSLQVIVESTVDEFASMPGFGKSKANNLVAKLKTVKLTEANIIEMAMVKGIASSQSKRLIEHFGSIDEFISEMSLCTITSIEGMGGTLANIILENRQKFVDTYEEVKACGFEIVQPVVNEVSMNVVCTGTCSRFGRKELAKVLESKGVKMQSGVGKDTDVLLTNDPNSNSGKTKKAKSMGIKIMSYDDFFQHIGV